MKIEMRSIDELKPFAKNPKKHPAKQIEMLKKSMGEFGFTNPILVSNEDMIIAGHGRMEAAKAIGLTEVPTIMIDLPYEKAVAYVIADNRLAELAEEDSVMLAELLDEIDDELMLAVGFSQDDLDELLEGIECDIPAEIVEDEAPEVSKGEPITQRGDVWALGKHRLMCGDSTDTADVSKLMDGTIAALCFTDPPYGMGKEGDGILNDNLYNDKLLEFNKRWIPNSFKFLTDVGSWYCWGIDEPLMDIYATIIKPMCLNAEATFRNLLTWNKGNGQGQMSEEFRSYATADEKCLFVMKGVQGFNTNSDNYYEGWEPIRTYLYDERMKMGWDVPTMKEVVGHSVKSLDHWTCKSQWTFPTRDVYEKMRGASKNDAFKKEYDAFKKEYDEIKKEYYDSRAYFDNTHDNMNNVWDFSRTSQTERADTGGHASPKPIELCTRAIKSSSRANEGVLDLFGGSGSTMMACEQTGRINYSMELDEKYCDVIIQRYVNLTGDDELTRNGEPYLWRGVDE